jgi:hypothetical protein
LLALAMLFTLMSCGDSTNPDQVAAPVFTPDGGTYATGQTVTITCATEGAEIRYTTDGTAPDQSSQLYAGPFMVSATATLRARAYKEGLEPSQAVQSVYTINITQIPGFAYVQGGDLWIGRAVYAKVSSFYMGLKEITQNEFYIIMGFNPTNFGDHPNCPADSITWYHAVDYCNRRSNLEGLTPCYTYAGHGTYSPGWPAGWQQDPLSQQYISCDWQANGYRLPAEMEWMWAAKGGIYAHGYDYAGSNDIDAVAWHRWNSGLVTHDVGLKQANELGLYDMTGNIYEWCWDIAGDWPATDVTDYHGASAGWYRCFNGGSWTTTPGGCYVWMRHNTNPNYTIDYFGFRVARTSP